MNGCGEGNKPVFSLEKYEVEIELIDKDDVIGYIKEHPDKVVIMNSEQLKDVFNL